MTFPANPYTKVICATDTDTAAATTVTLAATTGKIGVIWKITASYSTAPAAVETLTVVAGSTTIFTVALPAAAGIWDFDFPMGLSNNTANEAVVVTLSDPGGAVVAHLSVGYSL
jgi:hypothetical protein